MKEINLEVNFFDKIYNEYVKAKVSDMRSTMNNIEEKTRPISDSVVTDYFAEDLLPLVTIADKVEMGKTKALIYAFKLGFRAGKMDLKEELHRW